MNTPSTSSRSNKELLKALCAPLARFYPFDLHTHSIGSYDVCLATRFEQLPDQLKTFLRSPQGTTQRPQLPLSKEPPDHGLFDQGMATSESVEAFYQSLCVRRNSLVLADGIHESDNWALIGITDHNVAHFAEKLSILAWERRAKDRLIILPGLELEVRFPLDESEEECPLHILCLYQPCTQASDIRVAINDSRPTGAPNWDFGHPIPVPSLPSLIQKLRAHTNYPALCIAAHVWSSKGIASEPKKLILASIEADIARLEGELERTKQDKDLADEREIQLRLTPLIAQKDDTDGLHLTVLRLIGQCGFDALQVRDQSHEAHYRRLHRFRDADGRAIPIVSSDAHSPTAIFSSAGLVPYMKLDVDVLAKADPKQLFNEIRKRSLRFGETRTTYSTPGRVSYWIEGLEIVPDAVAAREFWQEPGQGEVGPAAARAFTLPLSRNLNCFVGGRGSGKSALIEAIAFLTDKATFKTEGGRREKERPEWYRRAEATLRGCRLRLVWKTTAEPGIGTLPKRALVVSRYFDPDGRHTDAEIRDSDDNAIVDAAIKPPQIRLLRAHDIEQTAESDNLRNLFDDLCGEEIDALNKDIEQRRNELVNQRATILEVSTQLAALTLDNGPLRQYGIRKKQFEVVDKPELRERFEQVDHAETIAKGTKSACDAWIDLDTAGAVETLEENVTTFFDDTAATVVDESGVTLKGYEPLHALLKPSTDPNKPALRETVLATLRSAKTNVSEGNAVFATARDDAAAGLQRCRDELAKDGFPKGSSEREAKKRAFDEAKVDHQEYQGLLQEFDQLLVARKALFDQLVEACKRRTKSRVTCAEALTAQLRRDLDGNVIRIEVEAKPLAEKAEFALWLEKHLDGAFPRFKLQRRAAIVESGLLPIGLREILLHDGTPEMSPLMNQRERADDGRIAEEDCRRILELCRGRKLVPLDESETWEDEFTATLPNDLKKGVLIFPTVDQELCISHVLQLDEVILDDVPEIRLNDRPTEPKSVARPLRDLSPGQRCSAILPILLLSGDYPLVIDQPEENLDNRLIRQVIVNILASMKLRRQVIIATHNPNLPVLGDVEQCVVLQASGRDLSSLVAIGNLDSPNIAGYITDIMEGGREAFQYRQSIYQTHWDSVIDEAVPV